MVYVSGRRPFAAALAGALVLAVVVFALADQSLQLFGALCLTSASALGLAGLAMVPKAKPMVEILVTLIGAAGVAIGWNALEPNPGGAVLLGVCIAACIAGATAAVIVRAESSTVRAADRSRDR